MLWSNIWIIEESTIQLNISIEQDKRVTWVDKADKYKKAERVKLIEEKAKEIDVVEILWWIKEAKSVYKWIIKKYQSYQQKIWRSKIIKLDI